MGFTVWIQHDSCLWLDVGPLWSTRPRIGCLTITALSSADHCRSGLIRKWLGHRHQVANAVGSNNSVMPPPRLFWRWRFCLACRFARHLGLSKVCCDWLNWTWRAKFQHLVSMSADTENEPAALRFYRATEPTKRQHRHQNRRWRRVKRTKAPNTAFGVRYTLASMRRRLKCGRLKSPTITWVTHPCFPNFWTKFQPIRTSLALLRMERMIRAFHRSGMNWSRGSIPRRPSFRKCHEPIAARNAHVVVPLRRNAKPWKPTSA